MRSRRSILYCAVAMMAAMSVPAFAQFNSSITFHNGAGSPAVVKLVGPSSRTISLDADQSRTAASVAPGRYHIVVRYGDSARNYRYTKGAPFDVEEYGRSYSEISITLYAVSNGNYGSRPAGKEEFDGAR